MGNNDTESHRLYYFASALFQLAHMDLESKIWFLPAAMMADIAMDCCRELVVRIMESVAYRCGVTIVVCEPDGCPGSPSLYTGRPVMSKKGFPLEAFERMNVWSPSRLMSGDASVDDVDATACAVIQKLHRMVVLLVCHNVKDSWSLECVALKRLIDWLKSAGYPDSVVKYGM